MGQGHRRGQVRGDPSRRRWRCARSGQTCGVGGTGCRCVVGTWGVSRPAWRPPQGGPGASVEETLRPLGGHLGVFQNVPPRGGAGGQVCSIRGTRPASFRSPLCSGLGLAGEQRRRWPGGSPWCVAFPDDCGINAPTWQIAGCWQDVNQLETLFKLQRPAFANRSWWMWSPWLTGAVLRALWPPRRPCLPAWARLGGPPTSSQDVVGSRCGGGPSVTQHTAVRVGLGRLLTHVRPWWPVPSRRCAWRKFGEPGCGSDSPCPPPPAALPDWLRTGHVTAQLPSQTRARSRGYVGTPITRAPCALPAPFCRPGLDIGSASQLSTCELLPGRLLRSRPV